MEISYVPLLNKQRELYAMPRGYERFREYIATLRGSAENDMELPLGAMNPMGKDHIPALLDQYLALNADEQAAQAVQQATTTLHEINGDFRATLVIADDAMGQWTNRYATEFGHRFQSKPMLRRGWLVGLLWTSEEPNINAVRLEILTTLFRGAYILQNGYAETLEQMLAQEGYAMAHAGFSVELDADEIEYTQEIIAPHLQSEDYNVQLTCLFGDPAARQLGYEPQGLSARAGFQFALAMQMGC